MSSLHTTSPDFPQTRFSRLRVAAHPQTPNVESHFFEVREAADAAPSDPKDDGVIDYLISAGDPRAAKAIDLWKLLVAQEAKMVSWLESDAANATLFFNDPKAAVQAALPGFPMDKFAL